jgi:hypothetical protein
VLLRLATLLTVALSEKRRADHGCRHRKDCVEFVLFTKNENNSTQCQCQQQSCAILIKITAGP